MARLTEQQLPSDDQAAGASVMGPAVGPRFVFATASAVFASVLSSSILAIAFPDLRVEFAVTYEILHQRTVVFFVLLAAGLPLFGALADRVDPARLLRFGLLLFILASLVAGSATSWRWFVGAQALQAIADAMIVPAQMVLIRHRMPSSQLGRAFAGVSAVTASARVLGPAVGGLMLAACGWRSLMWGLAGLALLALAQVQLHVPRGASPAPASGRAFELLPPGLLDNRVFVVGALRIFLVLLGGHAMALYFPTYLRDVEGLDPRAVGGLLLLTPLLTTLLGRWTGRAADSAPRFAIGAGLVVSTAGAALLLGVTAGWPLGLLVVALLLTGSGSTFIGPAQTRIVAATIARERTGSAMGLFLMVQFASGAVAGALLSPLLDGGTDGAATHEGFAAIVLAIVVLDLLALATLALDGPAVRAGAPMTHSLKPTAVTP